MLEAREAIALWSRMSYGYMGRTPGLQGVVHGLARRRPGLVRAVRGERAQVVPGLRRAGAVPQPRADQPADRPQQGRPRGRGRVRPRDRGARRRHGRARREDARDRLGAHARDVRGAEQRGRARAGQGGGLRAVLHRADVLAGREADLARVLRGAVARSPFDYPLSSRFDENDAVVVFDNVFVPWEDVLVYRDVRKATAFYAESGFMPRYTLQSGHAPRGQARLPVRPARAGARGQRHGELPRRAGAARGARSAGAT